MAIHNVVGKEGENEAAKFLEKKGYQIIERNWRSGKFEVDLIARKANTIVVVEVKTRSGNIDQVEEILSDSKLKKIAEAANRYMEKQTKELDCRIDVLLLQKKSNDFDVIHYEDAINQT